MPTGTANAELNFILEEARRQGFLGPGPVIAHIEHSLAFQTLVTEPPGRGVDLGSGGGVPGLPLALSWPGSAWLLVDSSRRRTDFLSDAVEALGLTDRVTVRCQRAEEAGRDIALRSRADLVVARGFGPPSVTAECAAALAAVGGGIVVAEPPGGNPARWPATALAQLGLLAGRAVSTPVALQRLEVIAPCPERFPRRTGIPAKRPLF